uniref:Uncharacterized protein n=1 Tax=viral metagenome TaxID=1070528 RepID=A0A6H2A5Q4_9ZZZZ
MNIQEFANLVSEQQKLAYAKRGNTFDPEKYCATRVIPGKKYTKVDVGSSGKFMIDSDGNIFGIKGYGVIHRGHHYGTLNTVNQYFWGEYHPIKIK